MSRTQGQVQRSFVPSLLLASALIVFSGSALALDPPLQASQYAHTSWTAREGANLGLVFSMAQTPDGYLWIAGSFGLFRFDGLRFLPWQPPDGQSLPAGPYRLLVSRNGTLWIGTFLGLSSWDGRTFTQRYPEIGARFVTSLLEDRDGTMWAGVLGDPGQLCAIRAGQVKCSVPEEGSFGSFVWSLAEDGSGNLWAGADSGVWRWRPGAPRQYSIAGRRLGDLTTTVDGQILAGIAGGGLRQVVNDQLVAHQFARALDPEQGLTDREIKSGKLLRDRDGGLWIGTEGLGLIHVKDGRADTFTRSEGLSGNVGCSLFEDREGNIWYGSERGVDRFRKLPATTLSTKQGLPDEVVRSVLATTDGSIWVATNDGLARWKDGRLLVYKDREGLPDVHVQSQYQDADGRHWVSTARGLAYFANDRFVAVPGDFGDVYAMSGDAAGNLWLSGSKGLARLQRGRVVDSVPWETFGSQFQAQVVIADQGGVWLSFWDRGGVLFFKDGTIQANYTPPQEPHERRVSSMRLDADGALWVATIEGGISRIKDGRITTLTVSNGLPCRRIHWSTLDDSGSMWMYTVCGLVQIARDDLAAWVADPNHQVTPKRWDGSDGVPLAIAAQAHFNPPAAKGPDGKLWFVAGVELLLVAPDDMPFNPVPPPVHVRTLVADHRSYAATQGLSLPPLVRDITIEFVALSLADPKSTRFSFQLDGHDNEWQEAVDRRQATYTNLPPGNYRFRVKAANNSGVWNEEGAQFEFSILPAFYQTTWFRVVAAGLLIGLAWSGFQLRLHLRIRRLRQQFNATLDARVAERTRIARDLHDTLLQSFHGMLLQFQAAFNLLPERPNDSKKILAGAIDQAAQAITEGRNTVQGLRASVAETNNLAHALQALAEELANMCGHATSAQVDVAGAPQALHPVVRDETFRIAGEALRNAFRHADAGRIEVEVRYDAGQLLVRVRDDGKGIDPEVLRTGAKEGHFGLRGMRERAELVGGLIAIGPGAAAGTEVVLSVPAARAYSRPSAGSSWLFHRWLASSESGE